MEYAIRNEAVKCFLSLPYCEYYLNDFAGRGENKIDYYINLYDLYTAYIGLPEYKSTNEIAPGIQWRWQMPKEYLSAIEYVLFMQTEDGALEGIFNHALYDKFLKAVHLLYLAVYKSHLVLLSAIGNNTMIDIHISIPVMLRPLLVGDKLDKLYPPESANICLGARRFQRNRLNLFNTVDTIEFSTLVPPNKAVDMFEEQIRGMATTDLSMLQNISITRLLRILGSGASGSGTVAENVNAMSMIVHIIRFVLASQNIILFEDFNEIYAKFGNKG